MLGITIATAAMVCILSVFNGFEGMVADLFTTFDPELKVEAREGKYFRGIRILRSPTRSRWDMTYSQDTIMSKTPSLQLE